MLQIEHKLYTEDQNVTVYANPEFKGSITLTVAERDEYKNVTRLYLTAEQALGLIDLIQTTILEGNKHLLKL